jgi:hypothetical protein
VLHLEAEPDVEVAEHDASEYGLLVLKVKIHVARGLLVVEVAHLALHPDIPQDGVAPKQLRDMAGELAHPEDPGARRAPFGHCLLGPGALDVLAFIGVGIKTEERRVAHFQIRPTTARSPSSSR